MKRLFSLTSNRNENAFYSSYDDALQACGGSGYQADDLVKLVIKKNEIYRNEILASGVIGLEALRPMIGIGALVQLPRLSVLDFGGGGGAHYSAVRAALGNDREIRWNVVETPAMAKAANEKLAGGGLKFFDSLEAAANDLGEIDLVFTSGTLPSTPAPLSFLSKLVALKAKHLFVTRTSFNLGDETLISVQSSKLSSNGPGPLPTGFKDYQVRYPLTLVNKSRAEEIIAEFYNIRFFTNEDQNAYKINGENFHMYGYFCELNC